MAQCKGVTTEKKRCTITAKENGFCGRHQKQATAAPTPEPKKEPTPPAVGAAVTTTTQSPARDVQLYPVIQSLEAIEALIEEAGGEITEGVEKALDSLLEDFDAGAELLLKRHVELVAGEEGARGEARRLGEIARGRSKMATTLKSQLLGAMRQRGMMKLEVGNFKVARAASNRALVVDDPSAVHPAFRTEWVPPAAVAEESELEYAHRLVALLQLEVTSPDRDKILAHYDEWVTYHTALLEDPAALTKALQEHGKMTAEEVARVMANQSMPEGITVRHGQHLRIK